MSVARGIVDGLSIVPKNMKLELNNLSGGNQQKTLLGKWLATKLDVLFLDEPTRGVDIGAKQAIHNNIRGLAESGMCIILISSDLPELVALSDRIVVLRNGRLVGEMRADDINEQNVLLAANGEGKDFYVQQK